MSRKVRSKITSINSRIIDHGEGQSSASDDPYLTCNSSRSMCSSFDVLPHSTPHTNFSFDCSKREFISIHIGHAGVQIAQACWPVYCLEHNVSPDGRALGVADGSGDALFQEAESGQYVPRAVLVDLEPTAVDTVRKGKFRQLFHADQLLSGYEDASNNYARGFYSVGEEMVAPAMSWIHRMADGCDSLQGFFLFRSLGGGTGSGFTSRLLQQIHHEFPKKNKLEFIVHPSPKVSSAVVEPYNTVLTTNTCMDMIDCSFMMDNEALYDKCVWRLDIDSPNFSHLNSIIGQVASSVTGALRFSGALNMDMAEFQTNLVPFPSLHFPVISYAPLTSHRRTNHETLSVTDITRSCFDESHQLLRCDMSKGKYMACCLLYRGDVTPKEIYSSIATVKRHNCINFVDWNPSAFKVSINPRALCTEDYSNMARVRRAVCVMSNSTAVAGVWQQLHHKFSLMHHKKAFIHWYTIEGMCDDEIQEAGENLLLLKNDYEKAGKSSNDD